MSRTIAIGLGLLVLTGCDSSPSVPMTRDSEMGRPAVIDRGSSAFEAMATELAADRERLDAVRAACKADAADATPALCEAAAEATRRRFRGTADSYRPREVSAFPTEPELKSESPAPTDGGR
jgi:hypothetical protein